MEITEDVTATLLKVTVLHGCFSRFLNCANGTKSRKASHQDYTLGSCFEQMLSIEFFLILLLGKSRIIWIKALKVIRKFKGRRSLIYSLYVMSKSTNSRDHPFNHSHKKQIAWRHGPS